MLWGAYPGFGSESAAVLEAESGYSMEAPEVSNFRRYVLDGSWAKAEAALLRLGVSEEEGFWVSFAFWMYHTLTLIYFVFRTPSF